MGLSIPRLTIICLSLLFHAPLRASVDIWDPLLPRGIVPAKAALAPGQPQRLLVSSYSHGLFLSEDSGTHWTPVLEAGYLALTVLRFDPLDPLRVYARDQRQRLYASDDGGLHWAPLGVEGGLYISPRDPNVLYVTREAQLIRSQDRGNHWQVLPPAPGAPPFILTLALDPSDPQTLLVVGSDFQVYRSEDGGLSWTGSTDIQLAGAGPILAISPVNPDVVVAGSYFEGLWRSGDGGGQWQRLDSGHPTMINQLHYDAQGRLYAVTFSGLYVSDDNGESWQASSLPATDLISMDSHGTQLVVYPELFPNRQIFLSRDRGESWTALSLDVDRRPWPEPPSDEVLYLGSSFATWFAGIGATLYRSDDAGRHWDLVYGESSNTTEERLFPALGQTLSWLADDPDRLYTPVFTGSSELGRGLLRSLDGGLSWTRFGPLGDLHITATLLDPDEPGFLAVAGTLPPPSPPLDPVTQVAWSNDSGESWQRMTINDAGSIAISDLRRDPQDAVALLVGSDRGVFRVSEGRGVEDLTARSDWPVTALDAAPGRLVATVSGGAPDRHGVAISDNGGLSWVLSPVYFAPLSNLTGVVMDPDDPDRLWLAVNPGRDADGEFLDNGGIYESVDGGLNWQRMRGGLYPIQATRLSLSPSGEQLLTENHTLPLQRSVLWWDPTRAGMGVALEQRDDTLWGTLYYYDTAGASRWALFSGTLTGKRLSTDLLTFSGPPPDEPWDIDQVQHQVVGQISLQFQSALAGSLVLSLDGVEDSLLLQPFLPDARGSANHVWWQPTTSGQGLAVVQVGSYLNGAWYFYDDQGHPTWRVFQGQLVNGVLDTALLSFSGPSLGLSPWDPATVTDRPDGQVRITVSGPDRLDFEYQLGEVGGSLELIPFLD